MLIVKPIILLELPNTIHSIWSELQKKSFLPNFQYEFEYISAWAKYFRGNWRPLLLLVKNDDQVKGILPLMYKDEKRKRILPYRRVRFLGSGRTDFNVLLADKKDVEDVAAAALNWLCSGYLRWEILILDDIVEENPLIKAILRWAEKSCVEFSTKKGKYYYINLKCSWDDIWNNTSRKFIRKNINVARNRLNRAGQWKITVDPEWETERIVDEAIKISSLRGYNMGSLLSSWKNQRKFLGEIIESSRGKGNFHSYWMELNDIIIAYEFIFEQENVCYAWNGTFNPSYAELSPSRLLILEIIKNYHEKRFSEFNFMRGEAEYKSKWTPYYKKSYRFIIKNKKNIYGRLILFLEKLFI